MYKYLHLLFCVIPLLGFADFDVLMGKNTPHWTHVQQERDIEFLNRCKELYDRHHVLKQRNSETSKIPKIVHFIWLGPRSFPGESVHNVRTWMAQNPDWTFKFWTDRPRDPPCHGMETIVLKKYPFPYLGRCYETSENWGGEVGCFKI